MPTHPIETVTHFFQRKKVIRLSLSQQVFFVKQLSFLLGAHTPLLESITLLRTQASEKKMIRLLTDIEDDVANGFFLSTSLARFARSFDPCVVALIRIGEVSGTLARNLHYLSEELRKKHLLRRKMMGAILYPSIVTLATMGLVSMLTIFIFPKIMPLFTSMHVTLPWTTRTVLAGSTFLKDYGILTAFVLILLGSAFSFLYRTHHPLKRMVDSIFLLLPLVGHMLRTYYKATFCRTCHTLLASDILLPDALLVVHETTSNALYAEAYTTLGKRVRQGKRLSEEMRTMPSLFDASLCHMISAGEQTGNLPDTFAYLSHLYESDIDDLTKNLSNTVEPVLMSILGLVVGFVALSIITPIYEITQHLNRR